MSIQDIARQLATRAEQKRSGQATSKEPTVFATLNLPAEVEDSKALTALARSVVAESNVGVVGAKVKIVEHTGQLKEKCLFIKQAYVFLGLLQFPGDVRDLIIWFMGYSEGNYKDLFTVTQQQMADSMGVSLDTVQRKLKALEEFELKFKRVVIEIQKQPYDYKARKYQPTLYRVLIGPYVEEYAKRAKGLQFTERQSPELLQAAIDAGHQEMAEDLADGLPIIEMLPRKQSEKNVTPQDSKVDRLNRTHERIMREFESWCELVHQSGYSLTEALPKLQDEMTATVKKFWEAYENKQKAQ
jgi:hypothetical protein